MKKKSGRIYFFSIMYVLVFFIVLSIIILRLTRIIKEFDMQYIYLICILSALAIMPFIKKLSIGKMKIKSGLKLQEVDNNKAVESDEQEAETELKNQQKSTETNVDTTIFNYKVKDIKEKIKETFSNNNSYGINEGDYEDNRQIVNEDDPISKDNPIFSWYVRVHGKEFLIEPRFTEINKTFYNKLYVMLSKLLAYNEANNKKIKLILLIHKMDNKTKIGVSKESIEKLEKVFSPALISKLLKIETLEISYPLDK